MESQRTHLKSTNEPELYKAKLYKDYNSERSHWNEVSHSIAWKNTTLGKILQAKYICIYKFHVRGKPEQTFWPTLYIYIIVDWFI